MKLSALFFATFLTVGPIAAYADNDVPRHLVDHYICNEVIDSGNVTPDQFGWCTDNYLKLKLEFADGGISVSDYMALEPAQRGEVNSASYLAFKAWEDANPEVIASLKTAAKDVVADF